MKKILFNDKFGLTQAVLDGRKTMTRRVITCPRTFRGEWVAGFNVHIRQSDKKIIDYPCMYDTDEREFDMGEILPKYKVGEVVAIAQSYKDLGYHAIGLDRSPKDYRIVRGTLGQSKGWNNKMFVRSEACKHHIRITNVKIERLQDISDEECLREGVEFSKERYEYDGTKSYFVQGITRIGSRWNRMFCKHFDTPREAFAALIDKVSGKGVWESNPWVFAYEFELID